MTIHKHSLQTESPQLKTHLRYNIMKRECLQLFENSLLISIMQWMPWLKCTIYSVQRLKKIMKLLVNITVKITIFSFYFFLIILCNAVFCVFIAFASNSHSTKCKAQILLIIFLNVNKNCCCCCCCISWCCVIQNVMAIPKSHWY